MNYNIVYEADFSRVLPAIIKDCRTSIPEIKNKVGSIIKSYTDSKVSMVEDNCIFYRLETELGIIAGVFAISVNVENKTAEPLFQYIRPSFQSFKEIQNIINNFIVQKGWIKDYLF